MTPAPGLPKTAVTATANSEKSARSKKRLQEALRLRVAGQNIVGPADKLTHYDWDTGKSLKEIALPEFGDFLTRPG